MKPLIVANWKMNPQTLAEARALLRSVKNIKKAKVVICPPFVFLSVLRAGGAQDVFWENSGAYTGEISPLMLKNMGAEYVIVGHSERRKYFKETDETVNKKIKAVLGAKLRPILCIDKIAQIKPALKGVPKKQLKRLVVAYEPLFAIGTGRPCSWEKARRMKLSIRKILGSKTPVLYGGSVNAQNAKGYLQEAGFQGLLVGGASLKAKEFIDIIKTICYLK
jgi:triosephosphate isomerase